jgi:sulfatase-like protein
VAVEVQEDVVTEPAPPVAWRRRVRQVASYTTTVLACVPVLFALVGPNQLVHFTPAAFLRIPAEGLVAVALLLVLPPLARRVAAIVIGVLLGALAVLKVTDMGFFGILARPFDPVLDWPVLGATMDFLVEGYGRTTATVVAVLAGVLVLAVLVLTPLAVLRLSRLAAAHRTRVAGTVGVLAAGWVALALLGAQIVPGVPVAAHEYGRANQVYESLRDPEIFQTELAIDQFRGVPDERLLTGLRGKDVLLVFVESYGRDAIEAEDYLATTGPVLADGDRRLAAAGLSARSGFLTSSTVGGNSWLAHATLESGLWVDNQQRYSTFRASDRFTLLDAFQRAGWRTVGVQPGAPEEWPEAVEHGYTRFYNQPAMGYAGPRLNWGQMPDQYTYSFFHRAEQATSDGPPVMAEIATVSTHGPWMPPPVLVDWDEVGDGSVFNGMESDADPEAAMADREQARALYIQTIGYALRALISYLETFGDEDLVTIVLGDHQPAPLVTSQDASRDVPISIISGDPAVLGQISDWGWQAGLMPDPQAPVWRMDSFRDRFLTAFGTPGTTS